MQTFNLDLSAKRVIPLLYAKQRDVGKKIQVKLTDNQKEYSVPKGVTWSVWYSGKSGEGNYTKIDDRAAVVADGSTATVELIYQMLNNPGEHQMCLVMNGADGTQLGLWNIPYFVEPIPGADSKAATAYYQAFLKAQENAEKASDRAEYAAGRAEYAAGRAEEAADRAELAGGGAGNAVLYTPQSLTPAEQAQARENIGASTFYHTKREAIGEEYTNTQTYQSAYIYGLYDALMAKYPKNVQKTTYHIDDGTADGFDNYAYEISTRDYPTEAVYINQYGDNPHIKKPKYLILSGIHGRERRAVFATYKFISDLLSGRNIPHGFREGAIISVMPVGTPSSFDAFDRYNANDVNICRNFDWNWDPNKAHGGTAAASEKETQAIQNWLNANADAALFIDHHNNGALNEKVIILGMPYNSTSNTARKIALRGVNNIIPFWRDVIRYPEQVKAEGLDGEVKYRDTIFSYSATLETGGLSITYAQNVVGIPSIAIETSSFYGDHTDFAADMKTDSPEAVAMGAEALGNILLEFYKQEFAPLPEVGTPIYNGEALLNINLAKTKIYTWEEW